MTTQPISILIVDDQTLVREGFRKLLEFEPDFEVVATAGNGEAALVTIEQLYEVGTPPDVILMDIRMPHMDGIVATRSIKARWPDAHIVILTTFDDIELIHAGLQAGALGYSLKDITAEQLTFTVRTAARGQVLLQPDIASKVFASFSPAPHTQPTTPPTPVSHPAISHTPDASTMTTSSTTCIDTMPFVEPLTEREQEILSHVARGASNRQIAEKLYITEGTVKNHMSSILSKLGVRDRTQAVLRAKERGIV